jgi:hypothetical protein
MLHALSLFPGVWDPVIAIRDRLPGHEALNGLPETYTQDIPADGSCDVDFISTLRLYNIYAILHASVPAFSNVVTLLVRVRSFHAAGDVNCAAVVEDPSGSMPAVIQRQAAEDHSAELQVGAVILLRGVSVFCMGGPQVLCILPRNVARVWGPETLDPRARTRGSGKGNTAGSSVAHSGSRAGRGGRSFGGDGDSPWL